MELSGWYVELWASDLLLLHLLQSLVVHTTCAATIWYESVFFCSQWRSQLMWRSYGFSVLSIVTYIGMTSGGIMDTCALVFSAILSSLVSWLQPARGATDGVALLPATDVAVFVVTVIHMCRMAVADALILGEVVSLKVVIYVFNLAYTWWLARQRLHDSSADSHNLTTELGFIYLSWSSNVAWVMAYAA